jgi:osmotically-inducible protein OsmY
VQPRTLAISARSGSYAACYLQGVRGVTREIGITSRPKPKDIRKKIEAAFNRSAEVDAQYVHLESRNNHVILTGNVSTAAERDEAERVAWAAPGVIAVDNGLTVGA